MIVSVKKPRFCVIIFQGRCGSSWVSSMLDEHPKIHFEGEVLHELLNEPWCGNPMGWSSQMEWMNNFIAGNIRDQYGSIKVGIDVFGLKTKLDSVEDLQAFSHYLEENQALVIRLYRENRLKQILSQIRSEELFNRTGQWNISHKCEYIPEPIDIDIDKFFYINESLSYHESRIDSFVGKLKLPKLFLSYENLLLDTKKVMHHVYKFLDVDYHHSVGLYKKISPEDIQENVNDYNLLKGICKGTTLQQFL